MLLSRVANSIYWMSRYIERAENIARFIDVNLQLTLDRPASGGGSGGGGGGLQEQWMPLVSITGDDDLFYDRYDEPTRANVMRFLTCDPTYSNSIASCVAAARENARTVRETITSEMWRQINALHIMISRAGEDAIHEDRPHTFYDSIKYGSQLFDAITDATMSHSTAWDFCQLGRYIERADKTSRILDVKYFLLLPRLDDVGSPLDVVQWAALLRSAGALEMYRQKHGAITPKDVAGFLVLDAEFPRSLGFCLLQAEKSLLKILGPELNDQTRRVKRRLGRVRSELEFGDIQEIIDSGLHQYLDRFQQKLNGIDEAMNPSFFNIAPAEQPTPEEPAAEPQTPTQCQVQPVKVESTS